MRHFASETGKKGKGESMDLGWWWKVKMYVRGAIWRLTGIYKYDGGDDAFDNKWHEWLYMHMTTEWDDKWDERVARINQERRDD